MSAADRVTLREYLERVIDEKIHQFDLRFVAADNALTIRKEVLNKELGYLNKLRDEVMQDRGQFLRIEVFDIFKIELDKFKNKIENFITTIEVRNENRIKLPIYIGLASLVLSAVAIVVSLVGG